MTPVWQTEFGPRGNCYAACLATVLECELADVPDFRGRADWGEAVQKWAAGRGAVVRFQHGPPPPGLAIASGLVLDGTVHAVVFEDGQMVHDPAGRPFWRPGDPVLLWTLIGGS
jgi:hypothetical protein